jgi:thiol-disulfide isomerase/thioredoxin
VSFVNPWKTVVSLSVLLLLSGLVACEAESGGDDTVGGGEPLSVGSVLPSLSFRDPTDGAAKTTDALATEAGAKLLLINASAGWCTICKSEAPELAAWHETYGPQGLKIVYTLFEDANFEPASDAFALGWCDALELPFDCLVDEAHTKGGLGDFFDPSSAPLNMLVRTEDMVVVFLATGFESALVKEKIEFYLD